MEDRTVEITATEQRIWRKEWKEDSLSDPWDNIKCTSIWIIGVPEGEEREKWPAWENIWRDNAENFHNMGKETVNQISKHRKSQEW